MVLPKPQWTRTEQTPDQYPGHSHVGLWWPPSFISTWEHTSFFAFPICIYHVSQQQDLFRCQMFSALALNHKYVWGSVEIKTTLHAERLVMFPYYLRQYYFGYRWFLQGTLQSQITCLLNVSALIWGTNRYLKIKYKKIWISGHKKLTIHSPSSL